MVWDGSGSLKCSDAELILGKMADRLYFIGKHLSVSSVQVALINGVTIVVCCRPGKIPDNQICFLTRSDPENI